jgi:hypothetical protein
MCDGARDETQWTLHARSNGQPVRTAHGHAFIFSEEADAREFLETRPDAASLLVVPIPSPDFN